MRHGFWACCCGRANFAVQIDGLQCGWTSPCLCNLWHTSRDRVVGHYGVNSTETAELLIGVALCLTRLAITQSDSPRVKPVARINFFLVLLMRDR